jgi:hypothetical protein
MVRIFPRVAVQAKKIVLKGAFLLNTLPRKGGAITRYKDFIERSNVKLPPFERNPMELVFTSLSNSKGIHVTTHGKTSATSVLSLQKD